MLSTTVRARPLRYTFDALIADACRFFELHPLDVELVDHKDYIWPGHLYVRKELTKFDNAYGKARAGHVAMPLHGRRTADATARTRACGAARDRTAALHCQLGLLALIGLAGVAVLPGIAGVASVRAMLARGVYLRANQERRRPSLHARAARAVGWPFSHSHMVLYPAR